MKFRELKTFAIVAYYIALGAHVHLHSSMLFVTYVTVNLLTFVQIVYFLYVLKSYCCNINY